MKKLLERYFVAWLIAVCAGAILAPVFSDAALRATSSRSLPYTTTATSAMSVTPDCRYDQINVVGSGTGTFTFNAPVNCTPVDGQLMILRVSTPAAGILTYSNGGGYVPSGSVGFPAQSLAVSTHDYLYFKYDKSLSEWDFTGMNQDFPGI